MPHQTCSKSALPLSEGSRIDIKSGLYHIGLSPQSTPCDSRLILVEKLPERVIFQVPAKLPGKVIRVNGSFSVHKWQPNAFV